MRNRNYKNDKKEEPKIVYTASFKVRNSIELLEFLLLKLNTSRNNVKTILSHHQVLVNGNVVTQFNYMLGREDEVKISKTPIQGAPLKSKARPPRIEIIYEDDYFIAINKPEGLLSVESDKERKSAYMYVSEYIELKDKNSRVYIIHRIDKETSGVLVFAKDPKIHSILRLNWNDYVEDREYYAICEGRLPKKKDTIKTYLKENQNNLVYVTEDRSGSLAITNYEVINENKEYSLLKVLIDTGRKNQIRVHLNHIGHPIVYDTKYGYTKNPIKRLGLHASRLVLTNPLTKEKIEFRAKVPNIFRGLFKGE